MANAAITLRNARTKPFESNMGCTINAITMPPECQRTPASPARALHCCPAMDSRFVVALGLLGLLAIASVACSVPDVQVAAGDASTPGDDGPSGDGASADQAIEASGDDGGVDGAAGDAPGDAPPGTCPDATPKGFSGCCGSTPCSGTCNVTTCGNCAKGCNPGEMCCVRQGSG